MPVGTRKPDFQHWTAQESNETYRWRQPKNDTEQLMSSCVHSDFPLFNCPRTVAVHQWSKTQSNLLCSYLVKKHIPRCPVWISQPRAGHRHQGTATRGTAAKREITAFHWRSKSDFSSRRKINHWAQRASPEILKSTHTCWIRTSLFHKTCWSGSRFLLPPS